MRKKENRKKGTTLVEMIVTLLLISIMMTMAAASLSSAAKIFVRVQKTQYAQSIIDTVMTELRTITKDASGYVKIYPEESGRLDVMLDSIAATLEDEAEQATKRMVTLLEPVLIILMALIVGFIMIAVMLPIYQSYSAIENS